MVQTAAIPDLEYQPGDHVCAFYNGSDGQLHDIVAEFVARGLRTEGKCVCFIDTPASILERIPADLLQSSENSLQFFSEEEAYTPTGSFSGEAFLERLESRTSAALSEGYERLWLMGETSIFVRHSLDLKAWFATESQVGELTQRPLFILCMYNLDLYDGETVMYVLKTHAQIYVNGMIIRNPYYLPKQQFLSEL